MNIVADDRNVIVSGTSLSKSPGSYLPGLQMTAAAVTSAGSMSVLMAV